MIGSIWKSFGKKNTPKAALKLHFDDSYDILSQIELDDNFRNLIFAARSDKTGRSLKKLKENVRQMWTKLNYKICW